MIVLYFCIGLAYGGYSLFRGAPLWYCIVLTLLWPLGLLGLWTLGSVVNKSSDRKQESLDQIRCCHKSMDEFHEVFTDTILEETGKGIAYQDEFVRQGLIAYEVQAALAAAKKFHLDQDIHRAFAVAQLNKAGMSLEEAAGTVDATLQAVANVPWMQEAINGMEGYEELTLGTDALSAHVRLTLERLLSYDHAKSLI